MTFNRAWLAGFFDGEGHVSITLSVGRKQITIGIAQSGESGRLLLTALQAWLAEHGIPANVHARKVQGISLQVPYSLEIKSTEGYSKFLRLVLPYLHVKKVIAQDVLRYHTLWPSLREGAPASLLAKERRSRQLEAIKNASK